MDNGISRANDPGSAKIQGPTGEWPLDTGVFSTFDPAGHKPCGLPQAASAVRVLGIGCPARRQFRADYAASQLRQKWGHARG